MLLAQGVRKERSLLSDALYLPALYVAQRSLPIVLEQSGTDKGHQTDGLLVQDILPRVRGANSTSSVMKQYPQRGADVYHLSAISERLVLAYSAKWICWA